MKILILANFAPSLLNFRGPLLKAFRAEGHQVVTAAAGTNEKVVDELRTLNISYYPLPLQRAGMNPISDWKTVEVIRHLIQHELPACIFAYTHKPVIYSAFAVGKIRPQPKCFALISGLGFAFGSGGGLKQLLARRLVVTLYRRVNLNFSGVFFQNPDDRILCGQLGLVRPHTPQYTLRGSGIDLAHFGSSPLPGGAFRFLLIARLLADKGIREWVAAAALIKAKHPQVQFDLVGPFDPNPAAISQSELHTWIDQKVITYHGEQQDVRSFLNNCSVYTLPSYYREGTPRSVLEAMATGRAVITTDAPGCRETIFDFGPPDACGVRTGKNGMLVPVKSAEALAAAMERLIENPGLVAQMGVEGRRLVQEHYDVHKVNAVMMQAMGLL